MPQEISPQQIQQSLVEVVAEEVERYTAALIDADDNGWAIWEIVPDKQRLLGYLSQTIDEDLLWVVTEGYYDLWKLGEVPQLQALTLWQQAAAISEQTGQPIMDTNKMCWGMWLSLPKFIFERRQADFIKLLKAEMRKEVRSGAYMPAMQQPSPLPPDTSGQEAPALPPA